MATAEWPSTLPQSPLIEGFSCVPQDSVLRSKMDGYTKQRNRFTAVLYDVVEPYLMTVQQFADFKEFYHTTLGNGAEQFIKPDPESNVTAVYQFTDTYDSEFNGVQYRVTLSMEKLP